MNAITPADLPVDTNNDDNEEEAMMMMTTTTTTTTTLIRTASRRNILEFKYAFKGSSHIYTGATGRRRCAREEFGVEQTRRIVSIVVELFGVSRVFAPNSSVRRVARGDSHRVVGWSGAL